MTFDDALAACGLVAILRGIKPDEAVAVGAALSAAGIRILEVPLNSPDPFASIAALAKSANGRFLVGAGTVLKPEQVDLLQAAGGTLCVSPDGNPDVIGRAVTLGLLPLPGVFTPTEAFAAIRAGATDLKLFPAEAASPAVLKAWRAVLPGNVKVLPVGGISEGNMGDWLAAGAAGFGIGSSLFKPGDTPKAVGTKAAALVKAWEKAVAVGT
jgi:2-dehydro-3-deoxyphosphogalactonate aldolase